MEQPFSLDSPPSAFDADTAVTRVRGSRFSATVTPRWDIGGRANGGYLLALATRALGVEAAHPDPLVVSGFFLRPAGHGTAQIDVELLRMGRTVSTLSARVARQGAEFLRVTASFGDLAAAAGPTHVTGAPPQLPPPEDCVSSTAPGGQGVPFAERFDLRFTPDSAGWAAGAPSGVPELTAWLRFADGRDFDPYALLVAVDALPPTVFNLGIVAWVPTLELTCHVRARPAPGWLRCRVVTRFLIDGYLEEDAEVWDSQDRLVALGRQLARVSHHSAAPPLGP